MFGSAGQHRAAALLAAALLAGCPRGAGTTTGVGTVPTPTVGVGDCAEPGRDGVMSATPRLEQQPRDLDGDGVDEAVTVDRAACRPDGNCFWNVFRMPPAGAIDPVGCVRFVGTLAGVALEPLSSTGDGGMIDLRSYWSLGANRVLLQSYRFSGGGYQLMDALPCRRMEDERLQCADDGT